MVVHADQPFLLPQTTSDLESVNIFPASIVLPMAIVDPCDRLIRESRAVLFGQFLIFAQPLLSANDSAGEIETDWL